MASSGFYFIFGPTLVFLLIYAYICVVSFKRVRTLVSKGNSYSIGKLFYIVIGVASLFRTISFAIIIASAIIKGDVLNDDDESQSDAFVSFLIVVTFNDYLFVAAYIFLVWRYVTLFYTSHFSNWKISLDSDLPFFLRKSSNVARSILILCILLMGIIVCSLLYADNIDVFSYLWILAITNLLVPFTMIVWEIYLHFKFSGTPYRSVFLSKQTKLVNRVIIFWFVGRIIEGIFNILSVNNEERIFKQILFTNELTMAKMFLYIGLIDASLILCEIIPFHQILDNDFTRVFFKIDQGYEIEEEHGDNPFLVDYGIQQDNESKNVLQRFEINTLILTEKKFSRSNGLGEIVIGNIDSNKGKEIAVRKFFIPRIKNYLIDEISRDIQLYIIMQDANPNLLRFLGISYKGSHDLMLMFEYCENGPISQNLKGNYSYESKLRILIKAANCLHFLHLQNPIITHGHFSTDNLFVIQNEDVRISDVLFNNLKKFWGIREGYTNKGRQTSPELWEEKSLWVANSTDPASDVYSFGIVMWEIFSEQIAFAEMDQAKIKQTIKLELLRPKIPDHIPEEIRKLIELCWQQEPFRRPTIANVKSALEKALVKAPHKK